MKIHIVMVAYALDITELVMEIDSEYVTFHLFLHSKIPTVVAACEKLSRMANVRYHPYGTNRGLSVSWNDGIIEAQQEGGDAILVLNDDIEMSWSDPWILANAAIAHREAGIIVCEGYDHHWQETRNLNFVVWGVNPIALEVAGYMDQNCNPYGFEDSDYARRLSLCGIPFHNAGLTSIHHLGSQSQTVPELRAQNQITFAATAAYYRRKWGGLPGEETYTIPFSDPAFGWQIAASQRHDPYPGRGRTDLEELVKI